MSAVSVTSTSLFIDAVRERFGAVTAVDRASLEILPGTLSQHENSRSSVDYKDFGFFFLQPLDIYYVGGFGVMGWVAAEDYRVAKVDPLAEAAPTILGQMNADHVPAILVEMVRAAEAKT